VRRSRRRWRSSTLQQIARSVQHHTPSKRRRLSQLSRRLWKPWRAVKSQQLQHMRSSRSMTHLVLTSSCHAMMSMQKQQQRRRQNIPSSWRQA
jgi:hypothetical protein